MAQEKITLRLAESLPAGHVIHELVAKPFMELVTKGTNGQVTFQHYPAEQLGKAKDMAQLTVAGVADVSYIVPSYSSEKYPLTAVAELPGIFDTECQGSLAFYKISHNGGILETKEFGPNQLRPLVTIALPAYQIQLATSREVKTAKDLEGLKIRTTGGAMDLMMRSIGGVPVRMAAPEIYESLTRGTLDGLIFSYQSSVSYDSEPPFSPIPLAKRNSNLCRRTSARCWLRRASRRRARAASASRTARRPRPRRSSRRA